MTTGTHNSCFQQVQDGINKARSGNKDWEFVSIGTEISLGKFVMEYFTPLTFNLQRVVSTEDTDEILETVKKEAMEKVRGRVTRSARPDSPMTDKTEMKRSF